MNDIFAEVVVLANAGEAKAKSMAGQSGCQCSEFPHRYLSLKMPFCSNKDDVSPDLSWGPLAALADVVAGFWTGF